MNMVRRIVPRLRGAIQNITGRKRVEEARFRHAADNSIISKDLNGIITGWNDSVERIFGSEAGEVGPPVMTIMQPELETEGRTIPQKACTGERSEHYEGQRIDTTDEKEGKAAQAEFSSRLIRAQEEERARIARELHDDINQRLALLANGLERLGQAWDSQGTLVPKKEIRDLWQLTTDIATDLQHLSHKLHPAKLHYLGLAAATRDLCHEFSKQHNIEVECIVRDLPQDLDEEISLSLFRTIQESLRNVAKHSHAAHARVELARESAKIRLRVSDDGIGFNPDEVASSRGLGLISMQERLRSVGGELFIRSLLSLGTQVQGTAPATVRRS